MKKFLIEGFKRTGKEFESNGIHSHVLKNKVDNFITPPKKGFEYHRWAGSLKSSQAFAYNIFSGVVNVEFEFRMKVFDRDSQVDVKIVDIKSNTIDLFEVKAFEFINKGKINFAPKYKEVSDYKYRPDIANSFINFLEEVEGVFNDRSIYGGGIKQLCSHLLGILNTMNNSDYKDKRFILYSLCFDNPITEKFKKDLENYRSILVEFKVLVDKYLKEIEADSRIEYYGFLSAYEYIEKNKEMLGKENYEYIMQRYYLNR